ncbi:hypothetical protein G9A89_011132 [Geosiphon pyriformis]|nr:hypothetical protein G9A89_011132 [Geosiphon pyriformis]
MVIEENKTETLEKRVMRLGEELFKKIESYLIPDLRKNTYQPPQRCSQEKARKNNYYAPPQMPRNQYMPIPCQYPTTYQNQGAYQQQPMIANPNWHPEA